MRLTQFALALVGSGCMPLVAALGQQPIIVFEGNATGSFQLAGGAAPSQGQILVSFNDYWGVIRAAGDLAVDFGRITGTNLTLSNGVKGSGPATYGYQPVNNMNNTVYSVTGNSSFSGPAYADPNPANVVIIAGTVGHSQVIDELVAAGKLNVSAITGKWEAFVSAVVAQPGNGTAKALVIAGSDPRGTIYGLYDVSEQIGVSPWYFWADVPLRSQKNIYALPGPKVQASPGVKYRGFFFNDEQPALTDWVASRYPDTPYGAGYAKAFYSLVFELVLRLRANYLWPAIWGSMFEVDDPANQPLADAFEVVIGSSHTEPLMRAQNEFGTFYKGMGPWAYNLNNATIDQYFRYGVQRAKPYARNSLWTMGMRGTGDTAIEGLGVQNIVSMLNTLVQNQQKIISTGLGSVNISTVPQMWCLYKEVQSYIFEGLKVPEDVTLLWSDDNWGNVRRFPLVTEKDRAGGAGVYYHFDYVGDPRNYKWINTVQLTKTAEQMSMAYARGADRIWIVNVGDLKGLEIPLNHFLDLAYDPVHWDAHSAGNWTAAWAEREFGKGFQASARPSSQAFSVANIVARYSMFASRRKYELVEPETYSVINYGEADAVLAQWAQLLSDAQAVYDSLDSASQAAFFETILHPVIAGGIVHRIYITAAKNALYAGQKRNAANEAIQAVLEASAEDANLTNRWDSLLNGKWAHMMDQTHLGYDGYWQQPMRNTLPALTYVQTAFAALSGQVGLGVEGSNASVAGDDKYHANSGNSLTTPPLDPYGPPRRYFDVFSRGTKSCSWTAQASVPWLHLSQSSGTVNPNSGASDTRVYISVPDWTKATSGSVIINFTTPCRADDKYGYAIPTIQVPVSVRSLPGNFTGGFVESDHTVSMDGAHYQAIVPSSNSSANSSGVTYHTFAAYGRTGSGVGLWPMTTEKLTVASAPALEYHLYLFSNTTYAGSKGPANVTVFVSPSQNYLGDNQPLEYGIALYPANSTAPAPTMVRPVGTSVGQNMPPGWGYSVADSVWGQTGNYSTSSFNVSGEGAYALRIWALLPSVIVQKVVVDLGGVRPSYLGPPESFLVGRDTAGSYNATSFVNTPGTLGGLKA